MKKLFTLAAAAVIALTAGAKDYTDQLAITLNGIANAPAEAVISVNPEEGSDGLYSIVLNQFSFSGMLIGDVTIEGVAVTPAGDENGWSAIRPITKDAAITNGSVIATMLGGKVTVTINEGSKMKDDDLYLIINLPVVLSYGTFDVDAVFGTGGYQIKNSGFESFHTATAGTATSDEPDAWHSFMSCTGALSAFVSGTTHTFIAEEARPGSLGSRSVLVVSGLALGVVPANGTITTGQMQAGAMIASDPGNCAFLDFTNTATDGNGDPFYTCLYGAPDSVAVWMKFKQGTLSEENAAYKYATISAVVTDGTYYQDPEDPNATYSGVIAKAKNAEIESHDFAWQRITVPFEYVADLADVAQKKGLLVTISTNAQPGVGSTSAAQPDSLLVDDIQLIYNNSLTALSIKGVDVPLTAGTTAYELDGVASEVAAEDILATTDANGANVTATVEPTEGGALVTVKVTSGDYQRTNTYTVVVKGAATGIENTVATGNSDIKAIYTIDGRKVDNTAAKGIYIVRKADGTSVKVRY